MEFQTWIEGINGLASLYARSKCVSPFLNIFGIIASFKNEDTVKERLT